MSDTQPCSQRGCFWFHVFWTMAQVIHLLPRAQLNQAIKPAGLVGHAFQFLEVFLLHVLNILQPIVNQPISFVEQIQIRRNNLIGDVAVYEHFARKGAGDFFGGDPAIGTANSQKIRLLIGRQCLKIELIEFLLVQYPGLVR